MVTMLTVNDSESAESSTEAPPRDASRVGTLRGRVALVTGASSGIGRAVAVALAREGARICAVGRNPVGLAQAVASVPERSAFSAVQLDLNAAGSADQLASQMAAAGRLDILVHSAGALRENSMAESSIEDFDLQYATNVRAPYLLTQKLLPLLRASAGQVVFINSSAGLHARRAEIGQYAATKHALRAVADSLREEVNASGVRVLSVYLGRTATPLQEQLFRAEGRAYQGEALLQPEDVASVIVHSVSLPPTAEVTDISIRPAKKLY